MINKDISFNYDFLFKNSLKFSIQKDFDTETPNSITEI